MTQDLWNKIRPLLIQCCEVLLEGNGVPVTCEGDVATARLTSEGLVASIGFAGSMLRGSLMISAPLALITQALPLPKEHLTPEDLQGDWLCELSNQLLGRLKLRLAPHGVELLLSIPSAVRGRELESLGGSRSLRFSAGETAFFVSLSAEPTPSFHWTEAPREEAVPVHEGEMIFLM